MNRTEPDLPSIRTPLAQETALTKDVSVEAALPREARTRDHGRRADSPSEDDQERNHALLNIDSNGVSMGGHRSAQDAVDLDPTQTLDRGAVLQSESSRRSETGGTGWPARRWPSARNNERLTRTTTRAESRTGPSVWSPDRATRASRCSALRGRTTSDPRWTAASRPLPSVRAVARGGPVPSASSPTRSRGVTR